jgi:hypothetical protein
MVSDKYISGQFDRLSNNEKVEILLRALEFMQADNGHSKSDCIALAMGIPIFPTVDKIVNIDGYVVKLSFKHGEKRVIDFRSFLDKNRATEKVLLEDYQKFRKVEVINGALTWPEVGSTSTDFEGREQFFPYDIDPGCLYEHSLPVQLEKTP